MRELIGVVGSLLLIAGWAIATLETVKKKHSAVPFELSCGYFAGSVLLLVYSFMLNDVIFFLLNLASIIVALINLYYFLKKTKIEKR